MVWVVGGMHERLDVNVLVGMNIIMIYLKVVMQ